VKNFLMGLFCLFLVGCTQNQLTATWYAVEGVGYLGYDRYKRSDDVVLIKGTDGKSNLLCMRRGNNPLWGPSHQLKISSSLGFWEYVEKNRRIQIYENVAAAKYGKHKFVMSEDAQKAWKKHQEWMAKKFPKRIDYIMYEHLMRRRAAINEAVSELKQEEHLFKIRNK
jgi:hypothetical protein